MAKHEKLSVGIVIERRELDNPWQDYRWTPVDVIPGIVIEPGSEWKKLREGDGWVHFLIGSREIELFRGETEGYRSNLSNDPPRIYVVLNPGEEADDPEVVPFMVTVCPYEGESYTESGENIVEGVDMPPEIIGWVQAFIDKHHVDAPFLKRKQKKAYDPRKGSQRPRPRVDQDKREDS
ncbi:MAG: DUF3305 domain-containing protein [Rhodospirillales bacterium]|nr:DUF3305 domain-containing protein [Rhodospirillales bacterium]